MDLGRMAVVVIVMVVLMLAVVIWVVSVRLEGGVLYYWVCLMVVLTVIIDLCLDDNS